MLLWYATSAFQPVHFFSSVHCVFKKTKMMSIKSVYSVSKTTKMITIKYGRWWSKLLSQQPSPFLLTPSSRQPRRCQGPSQIVLAGHWKLEDQESSILGKLRLCLAKSPRPNSARSWQMASRSTLLLMANFSSTARRATLTLVSSQNLNNPEQAQGKNQRLL